MGTYLIDVSLPTGSGKNLSLSSHNGAVDATVYIQGEAKRVDIQAASHNGYVNVAIRDRPHLLPLHLEASTHNGYVTVALPTDFEGPLTVRTLNGMVVIQPSVQSRLRVIEDKPGEKRYWVGHGWDEEDEKNWTGDQCILDNGNGMVTVGLSDEYGKDESQGDEPQSRTWLCALPWCK